MLSGYLRNRQERFEARRDNNGTWRILDTWHTSLQNVGAEDELPDNHPAIIILSEAAFLSIMKEADRLGLLGNFEDQGRGEDAEEVQKNLNQLNEDRAALDDQLQDLSRSHDELKEKYSELQKTCNELEKKAAHTESFQLKAKAMDSLLKLSAMEDISDVLK